MDKILLLILNKLSFLYREEKMQITHAHYAPVNGGAGIVDMHNDLLALSFCLDRGEITLGIGAPDDDPDHMHEFATIMEFLTGNKKRWRYDKKDFPKNIPSFEQKKYYTAFIKNYDAICDLFSEDKYDETVAKLDRLNRDIMSAYGF